MRVIPFSQCNFWPAAYAKRGHAGTVFSAAGIEFGLAGATLCADQDRFSMTNLTIEIARQSSADLLQAVTSLLSQLTTSGRAITAAELDAMIASPAATLFLAKDGDRIVGMISLAVVQMPTGLRSYLEDLVVDEPYRQHGAATALLQAALDFARKSAAAFTTAWDSSSGTRTLTVTYLSSNSGSSA